MTARYARFKALGRAIIFGMTRMLVASFAALSLVVLAPGAAGSGASTLRVVDRGPLTVEGRSFAPLERVRVVVLAPETAGRVVVATRAGSFTATFDTVTVGRCEALTLRARGSRGSTAYVNFPAPACLPM
jgi:hypothetical protein